MYDPERFEHQNGEKAVTGLVSGKKKSGGGGFQSMGFCWQILKSILNSGYKIPTPIQRKAIPEILLGKDVVAMARTGSGKTAAFLLPMFQRLQEKENNKKGLSGSASGSSSSSSGPKALIMSPTRELALQTFKFTKQFGKYTDFKAAVILGGDKIEDQFEVMHENPDIIIATPGRFLHICVEMNYKLSSIEYVVFDEADRLFEMGFKEQLNEILNKLPVDNRQTLLFSATMPASLVEFARAGLQNPCLIRLDVDSKLSDKLRMAFFACRSDDKLAILVYLLNNIIKAVKNPATESRVVSEKLEQTIIFVATKHHVEFLKDFLEELGYHVSYCYSSLDQTARQINIGKFQNKKTSLMVVTDVAARGLDIPLLDNVINFNFPGKAKLYVHRVGRVARAGNYGSSYSLVAHDELPYMHELFEFLSKQIRFATDDMDADDWNEVYGSVPHDLINIEKDAIESLIESKIELAGAFQVQENAYKHYLKSRPLASSQSVKAAKNIKIIHSALSIHPIFKSLPDLKTSIQAQESILDKLKNYTTKSTIFEINKTPASHQSAQIMRKKRQKHDKVVEKYKSKEMMEENVSLFQKNIYSIHNDLFKKEDTESEYEDGDGDEKESKNGGGEVRTFDDEDLVIKITNNDDGGGGVKRSKKAERRLKAQSIIDTEHFIPYKPKNFNQEKALGINTNFNRELNDASLDLMADDREDMQRNLQKTKWDRKKKKFVSVQSTLDKSKKIRTESGAYIKASYKSNLYAKWLKTSKTTERQQDDDDDNDNNDGNEQRKDKKNDIKNKKYFGSSLAESKYFGNRKGGKSFGGKGGSSKFSKGGNSSSGGGGSGSRSFSGKGGAFGGKRKSGGDFSDSGRDAKRFKKGGGGDNESNGQQKKRGASRASLGLRSKDQIMKERDRKRKIQEFQQNRKKGGGGGKSAGRCWKPPKRK